MWHTWGHLCTPGGGCVGRPRGSPRAVRRHTEGVGRVAAPPGKHTTHATHATTRNTPHHTQHAARHGTHGAPPRPRGPRLSPGPHGTPPAPGAPRHALNYLGGGGHTLRRRKRRRRRAAAGLHTCDTCRAPRVSRHGHGRQQAGTGTHPGTPGPRQCGGDGGHLYYCLLPTQPPAWCTPRHAKETVPARARASLCLIHATHPRPPPWVSGRAAAPSTILMLNTTHQRGCGTPWHAHALLHVHDIRIVQSGRVLMGSKFPQEVAR